MTIKLTIATADAAPHMRETPWKTVKTRVFIDHPLQDQGQPTQRCADPDCDSYMCQLGHAAALMIAMTGKAPTREDGFTYLPTNAEVDHKLWKQWTRQTTKAILADVEANAELIERQTGVRLGKLRFARKAGCGCGCSPGYIDNGGSYDKWITLVFETPDKTAARKAKRAARRLNQQFDTDAVKDMAKAMEAMA